MVFLTFTVVFCSNGRLSVETLFKSSIFLVFTALTGIVGRMLAPMFLAQCAAFLEPHLFGDMIVCGTSTFALTFLVLSGGFLGAFLFWPSPWPRNSLLLFLTFSRTPNSFLTLWGSESCVRSY